MAKKQRTKSKTAASAVALLAFNYAFSTTSSGQYVESLPGYTVGVLALYIAWRWQDLEVPASGREIEAELHEQGDVFEGLFNSTDEVMSPETARKRLDTSSYAAFRFDCLHQCGMTAWEASKLWDEVQELGQETASD
jgi:hypothetical protein